MNTPQNTEKNLFIGFKGKYNASGILAKAVSENCRLLTNSFDGLKKDIKDIEISADFCEQVIMFGIDKNLKNSVRIERAAEKETVLFSALNLENISESLNAVGITNYISDNPTRYLCNEAYWYALQKFNGKAVFIHIPSIKNINEIFIEKIKSALSRLSKM